jgi:hypothetical protein
MLSQTVRSWRTKEKDPLLQPNNCSDYLETKSNNNSYSNFDEEHVNETNIHCENGTLRVVHTKREERFINHHYWVINTISNDQDLSIETINVEHHTISGYCAISFNNKIVYVRKRKFIDSGLIFKGVLNNGKIFNIIISTHKLKFTYIVKIYNDNVK